MHRQPLLRMLRRYAKQYPDEADVAQQIEQLVKSRTDCFERTCRPGHVTGSAWVLSHDRRHCALVHHVKLNRWQQPGGHADGQSNVAEVALRETQEETGLVDVQLGDVQLVDGDEQPMPFDIDVHLIPARRDGEGKLLEDAHQHHDIRFLLVAAGGQKLIVSDESHAVRWFSHEEVLEVTDKESVLRMLHKAGPY